MHHYLDRPTARALQSDSAFWTLYESAFPAAEREPARVIVASVEHGVGVAIRARLAQETIGLATVHLLRDPPATFLVYLAVSQAHRNRGLGPQLVEEAIRGGPPVLVWEVDAPEQARSAAERSLRTRRIEFFRRLGGKVVLKSYYQPPVNGGEAVPMLLMARGLGPTEREVEVLVRAMYFEKYGEANGLDWEALQHLAERSFGHQ